MQIKSNHPFLTSTSDIIELSRPLRKIGIIYFSYTRICNTGERIYLTTHPEILKDYFLKRVYLIGNTESRPTRYTSQMVFWSTLHKQYIYDKMVRVRGIDHGFYMIIPGLNFCEFYGFAADKNNSAIINVYMNQIESLRKFIYFFNEQAATIIKNVTFNQIILPFHNDSLGVIENKINNMDQEFLFKPKDIKLTQRQLECARHLIQGKKIREIGENLHLSARTVEFYINNIKTKLHCRTRAELIINLNKIIHDI